MQSIIQLLGNPSVLTWVVRAWDAMMALTVVLHVAVYLIPRGIAPYNALPWAFQIRWNLDLDFQTVTYTAVHKTWMARWSHLTLPAEQVAWAIVLLSFHPIAFAIVFALVLIQATRLREPPLALGVVAMWALIGSAGYGWLHAFGPAAVTAAEILLLVGPVLRFIGHAFEPIPPFVAGPDDAFVPLNRSHLRFSMCGVVVSGLVSEFAAALPHRLIVVQLFWLAQQFGYAPRAARPWAEASHLGAAIRANGWKAYDKTRTLVAPEAVTAVADV